MTNSEAIESNIIIAKFLDYPEEAYPNPEIDLEYHSNWGWLMSVINKIEDIKGEDGYMFSIDMGRDFTIVCFNSLTRKPICAGSVIDNKLESAYEAVVKFINWYNEKK